LKGTYPFNRLFNFYETYLKRYLGPHKVLAEKRSEAVKLKTGKEEKESSTGYGCISAAGQKLPFWIIAIRPTVLSHAKFNTPSDVIVQHTLNGWPNEQMMQIYLE
jgi:hypothetical protein